MMVNSIDRDGSYRADLACQAKSLRSLWIAVAIVAVNDAAHEWADLRRKGAVEGAEAALARFRRWLRSGDGRTVLRAAGIEPTARAMDRLECAVLTGGIGTHSSRQGRGRRNVS